MMQGHKKQNKREWRQIRWWVVIGLILIMGMLSAYSVSAADIPDDTVIARIDGLPVQMREFMLMVNKKRSEVFSYFKQAHGVEDSETFWTDEYEGESPSDIAKQYALDELKKIKTEQSLAIQYGMIEDADYDNFLAAWKAENERRRTAKANGEVIFGPVEYREQDYYNYLHSNLVIEIKRKLAETDLKEAAAQNLLDQYYEEYIDQRAEDAAVEIVEEVYEKIQVR